MDYFDKILTFQRKISEQYKRENGYEEDCDYRELLPNNKIENIISALDNLFPFILNLKHAYRFTLINENHKAKIIFQIALEFARMIRKGEKFYGEKGQ